MVFFITAPIIIANMSIQKVKKDIFLAKLKLNSGLSFIYLQMIRVTYYLIY